MEQKNKRAKFLVFDLAFSQINKAVGQKIDRLFFALLLWNHVVK
jgi:hypothetical protein